MRMSKALRSPPNPSQAGDLGFAAAVYNAPRRTSQTRLRFQTTMDSSSHARAALALLDELGDAEHPRIYDPRLRAALDPLRQEVTTLPFACSRCHKRIAWWALDTSAGFVIASERRLSTNYRRPEAQVLAGRGPRSSPGFAPWIESAMRPGGRLELVDHKSPGYPLRIKFRCRCGADYTLKNTWRLRAFLLAVAGRSSRIIAP
jgi:hypothetical protein